MSPDKIQARKMVLVSAFLMAAIAVYKDRKNGAGDTFHSLWGVGVVSMLLSILADFAPTIAGPFGILIVLGSLTGSGSKILDNLLGGAANLAAAPGGKVAATKPDVNPRTNPKAAGPPAPVK